MERIAVFLGPSLPPGDAARRLHAVFYPPAEQGSVVQAVKDGATLLVLVDGVFGTAPAVRHKEILWALSRGVRVCGAASMGALRAAELAPFGMAGHGLVYRWLRATPLADDDEVAIATAPAELGSFALTEALVDIRRTLSLAVRDGLIGADARTLLVEAARGLHFTERTWDGVVDAASARDPRATTPALKDALRARRVSQKEEDARGLLARIAAGWRPAPAELAGGFRLTEAWNRDLSQSGIILDSIAPVIC
jgi:hypothetical protein